MPTQQFIDFDNPSASRTQDRVQAIATRNESAREALSQPRRNKRLLDVLSCLAGFPTGLTRSEVAASIGCKDSGVCQAFIDALSECDEHNGKSRPLVEICGRRDGDAGRKVDVYRLTGRGHRVIIEASEGKPRQSFDEFAADVCSASGNAWDDVDVQKELKEIRGS